PQLWPEQPSPPEPLPELSPASSLPQLQPLPQPLPQLRPPPPPSSGSSPVWHPSWPRAPGADAPAAEAQAESTAQDTPSSPRPCSASNPSAQRKACPATRHIPAGWERSSSPASGCAAAAVGPVATRYRSC